MKSIGRKDKYILIAIVLIALAVCSVLVCRHIYSESQYDKYPRKYHNYVQTASKEFNVPEQIIFATIKTESNFKANAESSAGAVGLMQIMPDTFEWLTDSMLREHLPKFLISDPYTNIRYGTYMLSWLYGIYGNWNTVFAAYNAGVGNVSKWLEDSRYSDGGILTGIPFAETADYVQKQISNVKKYEKLYYNKGE